MSLEFWSLPRVIDCCPNPPRVRGEPSPSALGFVGLKPGSATAPAKMEKVCLFWSGREFLKILILKKKSNNNRTTSICQKHIIRCQYIYIYMSLRCILKWFNIFISNLQRKKLELHGFPNHPSFGLPEAWVLWPETAPPPPLAPEPGRPLLLCPTPVGASAGELPWVWGKVCLENSYLLGCVFENMAAHVTSLSQESGRKLWKHHGNSAIIGYTFCDFEPLETQTLFLILRVKKPSCIFHIFMGSSTFYI